MFMRNLIILSGATVGAATGGLAGFIIGIVLGAIVARLVAAERKELPRKPPAFTSSPPSRTAVSKPLASAAVSHYRKPQETKSDSRRSPKLIWRGPGEVVQVAGLQIDSGLIFTFAGRGSINEEPSAIVMSLPVADEADHPANDLGYYPSYSYITPGQRRAYLEWLAKGRTDEDPGCRALGYLFLFFYGLERRVFIDKRSQQEALEAIIALLNTYAGAHKSRSLRSYFLQLAHFIGWEQGAVFYRSTWPVLIAFEGDRPREENLRFALANLFQTQESLDWSMALRIGLVSDECRKSTVFTRVREQFLDLFQRRYEERYPGGMELQATRQPLLSHYVSASPGLYAIRGSTAVSLPNILGLHRQFTGIYEIWNSCLDDLSGYSRAVATDNGDRQLKTWLALPEELRKPEEHPLRPNFEALLASSPREDDLIFVQAGSLAALLGFSPKSKLSAAQSRQVCEVVETLDHRLALDIRHTGVAYRSDQELALYQADEAPPACFGGLVSFLFLAIVVASADGFIEEVELARFNAMIEAEVPSSSAWLHLRAAQESLKRDGTVAASALVQVAKRVPAGRQESLFRTLLHIAAADGEIGLDERKALKRIARALSMEDRLAEELLRQNDAFSEVTVIPTQPGHSGGEKIPARPASAPVFSLNQDRIKALTLETREVISLLSGVMDEEVASTPSAPSPQPTPSLPEWARELDARFHGAFMELILRDALSGDAFDALAVKYHLMPEDLLNGVNLWSDEALGDFLLERDEEVRIYLALLPETLKAA